MGKNHFFIQTNLIYQFFLPYLQIAKNYQEAETVVKNCEIKLIEIRGAIAALEEIQKANTEEAPTSPLPTIPTTVAQFYSVGFLY